MPINLLKYMENFDSFVSELLNLAPKFDLFRIIVVFSYAHFSWAFDRMALRSNTINRGKKSHRFTKSETENVKFSSKIEVFMAKLLANHSA